MLNAVRSVLILDCCFAEAIVRQADYFRQLGTSEARLFVASSRADQRTWEDDGVQHGIFSAHLLDLLNSGNSIQLGQPKDRLDVDGELFPVLCAQVPLYVFEHKQQRQEPVKGGVSMRPVLLPVAREARRFSERTAFGTALRRVRQLAAATAVGAFALLALTYTFAYYVEVDRSAHVRLRHGVKWLEPVFGRISYDRLDTGIQAAELSTDPERRYVVQAGALSGLWTQSSSASYRAWYDALRPHLDYRAAMRYDVLADAADRTRITQLTKMSQPADVELAAWALLDRGDSQRLEQVLQYVLGANRVDPLVSPLDRQEMDFSVLDQTPADLAAFASALRYAAAINPERTFTAYVGFLKACSMWLIHSKPEQRGRETQRRVVEDVVSVLHTLAKSRLDLGEASSLSPYMVETLEGLAAAGHALLARQALQRVLAATGKVSDQSVQEALAAFHGESQDTQQAAALRQLRQGLDGSERARSTVEQVVQRFADAGITEHTDLTAFLIAAAEKRSLSPAIVRSLLMKAQEAVERGADEFVDSEYARILAHGMSQVPEASRGLVYELIDRIGRHRPAMSGTMAEIYAALARQKLETNGMVQRIIAQASLAKPSDAFQTTSPAPGLQIVVGPGPWLYALAVLGTHRTLPDAAVAVLEKHAANPGLRAAIARALLNQTVWRSYRCWETGCRDVLVAQVQDAERRSLLVGVIVEALGRISLPQFQQAMQRLDDERRSEIEPEVRIALGRIRVEARAARALPRAIEGGVLD
jgi:hypothetical protein